MHFVLTQSATLSLDFARWKAQARLRSREIQPFREVFRRTRHEITLDRREEPGRECGACQQREEARKAQQWDKQKPAGTLDGVAIAANHVLSVN